MQLNPSVWWRSMQAATSALYGDGADGSSPIMWKEVPKNAAQTICIAEVSASGDLRSLWPLLICILGFSQIFCPSYLSHRGICLCEADVK